MPMPALRTRARRRATPARRIHTIAVPEPPRSEVDRHRRAGGPEDVALYTCGCGCSFSAAVSATVGCPRCGSDQAW